MFIEDVTQLLFRTLAVVLAVNVLFLFLVLRRRLRLQRYFLLKDSAREILRAPVQLLAAGQLPPEQFATLEREAKTRPGRDALHELLLAAVTPESAPHISEALFALGAVDDWARRAFGRARGNATVERAVQRTWLERTSRTRAPLTDGLRRLKVFALRRALAVRSLAHLAPEFSQPFLVEAVGDPASEVREVAIAGMGRSQHPTLIAVLIEELERSVDARNDVSWRWLTMALTRFRLEHLHHVVPALRHQNPQMRYTMVEITRQICAEAAKGGLLNKNDFSPSVYQVFLEDLVSDASADVRARSAAVIKHFRDRRSVRALRLLMIDENEFVRLHAVRACNDRFYSDLLPDLTRALRDPHWRVRDAAVQAMLTFGASGLEELYRVFLEAEDEDTSHQIVDGMQRAGAMPLLLASLATDVRHSTMATAVCQKMALIGDTVYLNRALASVDQPSVRISLMDALLAAPDEEYVEMLEAIATTDDSVAGARASEILRLSGIVQPEGH